MSKFSLVFDELRKYIAHKNEQARKESHELLQQRQAFIRSQALADVYNKYYHVYGEFLFQTILNTVGNTELLSPRYAYQLWHTPSVAYAKDGRVVLNYRGQINRNHNQNNHGVARYLTRELYYLTTEHGYPPLDVAVQFDPDGFVKFELTKRKAIKI